jgi:hypothetical protein
MQGNQDQCLVPKKNLHFQACSGCKLTTGWLDVEAALGGRIGRVVFWRPVLKDRQVTRALLLLLFANKGARKQKAFEIKGAACGWILEMLSSKRKQ